MILIAITTIYVIKGGMFSVVITEVIQFCILSIASFAVGIIAAELYVYRNPGQEIEQAISLNGSAYMDLPVALKFRKGYVNGCSCKQAEYNPTAIEEANKRAEAEAAAKPGKGKVKGKVAANPPATPAPQAAATESAMEVTGSNAANPPAPVVPQAQKPPLPAPAAAAPAQPAQTQAASTGAPASAAGQSSSSVIKKTSKPAAPPPQ